LPLTRVAALLAQLLRKLPVASLPRFLSERSFFKAHFPQQTPRLSHTVLKRRFLFSSATSSFLHHKHRDSSSKAV
jgi:hypothetical protein